jgi:DNA-binding response OmpR family regulator
LSDENGCAIARGLKKDAATADIPIIMVSAHPGGQKMAEESGADAYLGKPFEIDHLLDTIDRLGKEPRSIAAS